MPKIREIASVLVIALAAIIFAYLAVSPGPHPLQGQAAPPFSATRLDGQTVRLDEILGNRVILLDFWAIWCPPCRESLPKVARLWEEYRDRNVAVYAVNMGDEAQHIEAFLSDLGIDLPVLLDPEGSIGAAYGVSGIPHLVIIGLDGIVDSVHVGAGPGLDDMLRDRLDALLDVGSGVGHN